LTADHSEACRHEAADDDPGADIGGRQFQHLCGEANLADDEHRPIVAGVLTRVSRRMQIVSGSFVPKLCIYAVSQIALASLGVSGRGEQVVPAAQPGLAAEALFGCAASGGAHRGPAWRVGG
jgi:hypothetical protein